MNRDEIEKLLEGTTPGPWRAEGEPWNRIVWSSADNRVCFMAHSNGLDDARDVATSNLAAAAPDLARTCLALMAQLEDAEAAQALVLERAGIAVANTEIGFHDGISGDWRPMDGPSIISACCAAIRALAPASGVAALAELRAERDLLRADRDSAARMWQAAEKEKEAAVARSREASQMLAIETNHAAQAEAERDDALTRLAAAEAQVGARREGGE